MTIETNPITMKNRRLKNQLIINRRKRKVKPPIELQKEMKKKQTIINLIKRRS